MIARLASLSLLLLPALVWAQSSPSVPSSPGGNFRMGYSSGAGIQRLGGAPLAQPSYTPPALGTPGSTVGYVSPSSPDYKPVDGTYVGGYKPAASYAVPVGGTPSYTAPPPAGGTINYVPSNDFSPLTLPPPPGLIPPSSSPFSVTSTPATSTLSGSHATIKASDIVAPTDDVYTKALSRFNEGQYSDALSLLEAPGRDKDTPLPTRKLYVAALVADSQFSMAAYQAMDIARDYPLAFFHEPTLAATYQKNPELAIHLNGVIDYSRGNNGDIETCILLALYCNLSGKGQDPSEVLATAKIPDADKGKDWFPNLRSTLKPRM